MLDFSWNHLLILLIVALVVVGPKDLPKMMRMVGRWTGKAREMANQLRKSFDEMARQSELDELRAEIQALRTQHPLADVEQSLHQSILPPVDLSPPANSASAGKPESVTQAEKTQLATAAPPETDPKA